MIYVANHYWQNSISSARWKSIMQAMNDERWKNDELQVSEVLNQTKNKVRPLIFHNEFTFIYMTLDSNAFRLFILHRYRLSYGCKKWFFAFVDSFWYVENRKCLSPTARRSSRFSSYLEYIFNSHFTEVWKNYSLMCWKIRYAKKKKARLTPFFICFVCILNFIWHGWEKHF